MNDKKIEKHTLYGLKKEGLNPFMMNLLFSATFVNAVSCGSIVALNTVKPGYEVFLAGFGALNAVICGMGITEKVKMDKYSENEMEENTEEENKNIRKR